MNLGIPASAEWRLRDNLKTMNEDKVSSRLHRIEFFLMMLLRNQGLEIYTMSQLDDQIASLKAEVANNTNVEKGAVALLTGIPAMIATAVQKALAAGATPEQLQAITDVGTTLLANDTELAGAVAANTVAATDSVKA